MGVAYSGGGCGFGRGLYWSHDIFHGIINEVSDVSILTETAQRCTIINTGRLCVHHESILVYNVVMNVCK